ncbi:glycerate kinase [Microbacterium sp. 1P10UB]|uniref:glycerate kinase n=1 Tax=unclassified Microbacterium TaxID=2609290 RepID=UPI0039A141A0
MSVVIAVDSFKGSLPAAAAAQALAEGWRRALPATDLRLLPMADGGEGTLDAFAATVPGARRIPVRVTGPAGSPIDAAWLLLPPTPRAPAGTAVVELAATSGIELLGTALRPLDAGTRGVGHAIAAALDAGVSRVVVGIGSSASTDGGAGLLQALGADLTDAAGTAIADGGRGLAALAAVDLTGLRPMPDGGVTVLTDVRNPLLRADGAAAVFGPQKGATPAEIRMLDDALARWAALSGVDPRTPGAGAAGGAGYGLLVWGAILQPGASAVGELIGLEQAVAAASVVITGEGAFDGQSSAGKVPGHVAALAAAQGVPVLLVAGRIAPDAATDAFAHTVSLTELAGGTAGAMRDPRRWLRAAGESLARRTMGTS